MSGYIDQTILHNPERGEIGNCMQAAIASHLGLTLCDVPHFAAMGDDWGEMLQAWANARRLTWVALPPEAVPAGMPTILQGWSERGVPHVVVGKGIEMVHDPHPSRAGIVEVQEAWALLSWPEALS